MNCRKRPCEQCPWRKDGMRGQFPADRYEILRGTVDGDDHHAPIFGCHKSSDENTMPCAGWLASVGNQNIRVRMAVAMGEIPVELLKPGEDWPPLFESYDEMEAAQGGEEGSWSACFTEGCRDHLTPTTVVPGYPCPTCGRGKMIDVSEVIRRRRQA